MPKPEEGEAPAEDTSVSDVETSDEEFADWDDDAGFTDDDTESEEAEDSTEAEESDDTEESESDSTDDETEETEEDTNSDEQDKTEDKSKEQLAHEAFKRREAERKLREERESREKENLDRYLAEAEDDEAELAKRQLEVERFNTMKERIALNQDRLDVGIQKASIEIQKIANGDPVVLEAFAEALDDFEATRIVKDKYGNPVEVKDDVYQYLLKKADSIKKLTGIGAREQTKQKANEKMRTVTRPTRTPKEKPVDPDMEAFDEMANRDW